MSSVQQQKLSPPQFIPVPQMAAPVEHKPAMYAPRFDDTTAPLCHRVNEADLVDLSQWLVPRLMEKYERANPQGLLGWLHSVIMTGSYAFFRGPNSALLVERQVEPVEPSGVVREKFMRVRSLKTDAVEIRKAHYEEGLELYKLAEAWAKGVKCARFEYGTDSDIPDNSMYDASAKARKKVYYSTAF